MQGESLSNRGMGWLATENKILNQCKQSLNSITTLHEGSYRKVGSPGSFRNFSGTCISKL